MVPFLKKNKTNIHIIKAVRMSLFPLLPNETLMHIAEYANLDNGGAFRFCLYDKRSYDVMFTLKGIYARQILEDSANECATLHKFICEFSNQIPDGSDYSSFFGKIFEKTQLFGVVCQSRIPTPDEVRALSTQITIEEDRALETIWPKLCGAISDSNNQINLNNTLKASAIRTWLKANQTLLVNVQCLDLSCLSLVVLSPEIELFSSLRKLNVSCNLLRTFPPTIGELTSLQEMNATGNKFTSLPSEIGQLTALQTLLLLSCPVMPLPTEIFGLCGCPQLKSLLSLYILCSNQPDEREKIKSDFIQFIDGLDDFATHVFHCVWKDSGSPDTDYEQWKEQHAFDDIEIFKNALFKGLCEQIPSHSQEHQLFNVIYRLAGSPQADNYLQWGESHAYDDPVRLISACDIVRNKVVML